jgi:tetratricopeptide (TPR) repeat protein
MSNMGDESGALRAYREALTVRERLWRESPTDVEARAGLANGHLQLGSLAWTLHDTTGAQHLREGIALFEAIVRENPHDATRRNELLAGYARLRVPFTDAGDYGAAKSLDEKVLAMLTPLAAGDPENVLLQRNLSVSYNNLARDWRALGQPLLAIANHRRALAISTRLHEADRASVEHLRDVAFTEDVMAEALSDARARSPTSGRCSAPSRRTRGTRMISRSSTPDSARRAWPPARSTRRRWRIGRRCRWRRRR